MRGKQLQLQSLIVLNNVGIQMKIYSVVLNVNHVFLTKFTLN